MIEVEAPDGSIVEFPDGTANDVMSQAMQAKFGAPQQQEQQAAPQEQLPDRGIPGIAGKGDLIAGDVVQPDVQSKVIQGLTLGGADEVTSGLAAPVQAAKNVVTGEGPTSVSENFAQNQAREASIQARTAQEFPITSGIAEFLGSALTGGAVAGKVIQGSNRAVQAAKAAGIGAGIGATSGVLSGEGNFSEADITGRLEDAAVGAGTGLALGAIAPSVGRKAGEVLGKGFQKVFGKEAPLNSEVLKAQSQTLYKAAEGQGVMVTPQAYANMVERLGRVVRSKGFRPKVQTKAAAVLDSLSDEVGTSKSLQQIDELRQVVGTLVKSSEPAERRIGGILANEFDRALKKFGQRDVFSGDPKAAFGLLRNAQKLWQRKSKAEFVESMFENAGVSSSNFSGSGFENALRREFVRVAKSKTFKRMFTKAEQAAIKKVGRGGPIDNVFRALGKAAPTGIVSSTLSGGAGFAIGGPAGAVALPILGAASRKVATGRTLKNAEQALEAVSGIARPLAPGQRAIGQTVQNALIGGAPVANKLLLRDNPQ